MLETLRQTRRGSLPPVAVAVIVVYGAAATTLAPFTRPMQVATVIPCLVLIALALARSWHRFGHDREPLALDRRYVAGMAVWFTLMTVAVAVQLFNFFDGPRDVYPTLSSLAGRVFSAHPVRAAAFAAWLWLGWYFLDR